MYPPFVASDKMADDGHGGRRVERAILARDSAGHAAIDEARHLPVATRHDDERGKAMFAGWIGHAQLPLPDFPVSGAHGRGSPPARAHDLAAIVADIPGEHVKRHRLHGRSRGRLDRLVRAAGRDRGTALAELCRSVGCSLDETVVVGDWYNDVPMFEVAGRSFAMGGTPEAVRSKATDVLEQEHGGGGGIAEAIRRAWG